MSLHLLQFSLIIQVATCSKASRVVLTDGNEQSISSMFWSFQFILHVINCLAGELK